MCVIGVWCSVVIIMRPIGHWELVCYAIATAIIFSPSNWVIIFVLIWWIRPTADKTVIFPHWYVVISLRTWLNDKVLIMDKHLRCIEEYPLIRWLQALWHDVLNNLHVERHQIDRLCAILVSIVDILDLLSLVVMLWWFCGDSLLLEIYVYAVIAFFDNDHIVDDLVHSSLFHTCELTAKVMLHNWLEKFLLLVRDHLGLALGLRGLLWLLLWRILSSLVRLIFDSRWGLCTWFGLARSGWCLLIRLGLVLWERFPFWLLWHK